MLFSLKQSKGRWLRRQRVSAGVCWPDPAADSWGPLEKIQPAKQPHRVNNKRPWCSTPTTITGGRKLLVRVETFPLAGLHCQAGRSSPGRLRSDWITARANALIPNTWPSEVKLTLIWFTVQASTDGGRPQWFHHQQLGAFNKRLLQIGNNRPAIQKPDWFSVKKSRPERNRTDSHWF